MTQFYQVRIIDIRDWVRFSFVMICWGLLRISATVSAQSATLNQSSSAGFKPLSMTYVLQADALDGKRKNAVRKLRKSVGDLVVIDTAYDGDAGGHWTQAEVAAIRGGKEGRKVIAYLSIGEAEDYRPYWKNSWKTKEDGKPNAQPPAFLCPENPEWKGNYRVRYWHKAWQDIILAAVDNVTDQGFDGLYLDIVDGFEYFEQDGNQTVDNRRNPETANTYRQDMIWWVMRIAERARARAGMEFLIVPQNGDQLLADPNYVKTISAIGNEDLFTDGQQKQKPENVEYRLEFLKKATQAGKPVLLIEYPKSDTLQKYVAKQAETHGFTLLMTDRELKTLGADNP